MLLLKRSPAIVDVPISHVDVEGEGTSERIRCPICEWQPDASSVWCCWSEGTPEPFFGGCGAVWNTFSTRGRCPGCSHQWRWTSCLRCLEWSLHEDWYEEEPG